MKVAFQKKNVYSLKFILGQFFFFFLAQLNYFLSYNLNILFFQDLVPIRIVYKYVWFRHDKIR